MANNREEMTESLRRFGMAEQAIAKVWESEDMIAANERAKRAANRKPVEQAALDFGDWE
jgi:hypothetical protein